MIVLSRAFLHLDGRRWRLEGVGRDLTIMIMREEDVPICSSGPRPTRADLERPITEHLAASFVGESA